MSKAAPFVLLVCLAALAASQDNDGEEEQFAMFSEHMSDFTPEESFEFELEPSEQQTLIFWPVQNTQNFKGLFYITSDENRGLFVGVESNGKIQKSFYDKKIGVFNVPYKEGTGDMKIILKSEIQLLKIYVSYQLKGPKTASTLLGSLREEGQVGEGEERQMGEGEEGQVGEEENSMKKIVMKFQNVHRLVDSQQQILKSILKGSLLEVDKVERQIKAKTFKVIIETIIVIGSGCLSIWMLKKELKDGFELIV